MYISERNHHLGRRAKSNIKFPSQRHDAIDCERPLVILSRCKNDAPDRRDKEK